MDGIDVGPPKQRVCWCGLNRSVHEAMTNISNVRVHFKTRSGNVNINICQVPRKLFEHETIRLSVQTSPEAMKQACVIIMLAYFTGFQPKANRKHSLNLEMPFFLHWFSPNKLAPALNFQLS